MATPQIVSHVGTARPARIDRNTPALPRKPWSMLVYIGGDNDLSDNGIEDITEMCKEGANRNLHVGVEIDTKGEHTGSIRYEVSEPDPTGHAHRIVVERLPERNTGDPRTLVAFLTWGLHRYRAADRMLVVWGHGSGFRGRTRDVALDDFGSALDMPAVELALSRAGIGKGLTFGKLKVMGFDACLMAMVEIAHHFRDQTEFLVGSQQVEPGDGWPYNRVLAHAKRRPTAARLAKSIVDEYVRSYRASGEPNVTQSAIDTSKTPAAIDALHDLGKALLAIVGRERSAISRARSRAQNFEDAADYIDLIHFARLLPETVTDPRTRRAAARVVRTAKAAIVKNGTYGRVVRNANGLSMWFPPTRTKFAGNRAKYLGLHSNDDRQDWVDFLDAYFDR